MVLTIFIILFIALVVSWYVSVNNLGNYNKDYDKLLNQLMDDNIPVKVDSHTATFKDVKLTVWLGNYPYSYGQQYQAQMGYPSMRTRKRLALYTITNKE